MFRRLSRFLLSLTALLTLQGCIDLDMTGLEHIGDGLSGGGGYGGGWGPTCGGPPGAVKWVTLDWMPYDAYTQVGDSIEMTAQAQDGACNTVIVDLTKSWSSSDTTIASVKAWLPAGATATVSTSRLGVADITVTTNGVSASRAVHVVQRVAEIRMNPAAATIAVGDSVYVTATAIGVDGKPVIEPTMYLSSADFELFGFRYDMTGVWIFGKKTGTGSVQAQMFQRLATMSVTVIAR